MEIHLCQEQAIASIQMDLEVNIAVIKRKGEEWKLSLNHNQNMVSSLVSLCPYCGEKLINDNEEKEVI